MVVWAQGAACQLELMPQRWFLGALFGGAFHDSNENDLAAAAWWYFDGAESHYGTSVALQRWHTPTAVLHAVGCSAVLCYHKLHACAVRSAWLARGCFAVAQPPRAREAAYRWGWISTAAPEPPRTRGSNAHHTTSLYRVHMPACCPNVYSRLWLR